MLLLSIRLCYFIRLGGQLGGAGRFACARKSSKTAAASEQPQLLKTGAGIRTQMAHSKRKAKCRTILFAKGAEQSHVTCSL